ncbi:hypothetical protein Ddye_027647 [Dipteronia dyeriana]|uniref:DDE Tnp4 domain-containing protein n=1 Tax=Dipteronia dyeriana TaxID=168575 RepID=A0AAD9TPY3_9ROSI|nr:hypothetical protein Ddye_027647 [Dipteronia dyeriana]
MAKVIIKPLDPEFRSTPQEILSDSRYMPHFKDCIGAIDGVHVQASISPCDQGGKTLLMIVEYSYQFYVILNQIFQNLQMQVKIVIATMTIHNYIRRNAQRDRDFDESANYSSEEINEEMEINTHEEDGPGRREMKILRNSIAQSLMSAGT